MKKNIMLVVVMASVSFGGSAIGETKPTLSVPKVFVREISVTDTDVRYTVLEAGKMFVSMSATHDGKLNDLRIIVADSTVYDWTVYRDRNTSIVKLSGMETGENSDNTVKIDRAEWLKFFNEKVAMPAFEYTPDRSTYVTLDSTNKWEHVGIGQNGAAVLKTADSSQLKTVEINEVVVQLPHEGQFYVGRKAGQVCPIVNIRGSWYIPVNSYQILGKKQEVPGK